MRDAIFCYALLRLRPTISIELLLPSCAFFLAVCVRVFVLVCVCLKASWNAKQSQQSQYKPARHLYLSNSKKHRYVFYLSVLPFYKINQKFGVWFSAPHTLAFNDVNIYKEQRNFGCMQKNVILIYYFPIRAPDFYFAFSVFHLIILFLSVTPFIYYKILHGGLKIDSFVSHFFSLKKKG